MLNRELFMPSSYQARLQPDYYDDGVDERLDIMFQPEIYPAAEALLASTGRSRLVDVGCGIGRKLAAASAASKLGIDFDSNIAHCRAQYPEAAEWLELDLSHPVPDAIVEGIGPDDLVICSDVVEHLPDPRHLLGFLASCFQRGAAVMTSTPDRHMVHGPTHFGPPPNPAHVREWTCAEYGALLTASGLPPLYLGLTLNNDQHRALRTIVSLHEPRLQQRVRPASRRPLAILSCFNEADVLDEVIAHWIGQGCDVHVLDNWSTDDGWAILQAAAQRFGPHLTVERFPAEQPVEGSWRAILARKEEIAFCHKGRWVIHTDADEIRVSPFAPYNLADAMGLVEAAGWNRINFTVLNHRPVDDSPFGPGMLASALPHFEYGTKPGHFIQKKAWLQGDQRVCLTDSGGHLAEFAAVADCPYHFVLHHYPLRSAEHGRRKIDQERHGRWSQQELDQGWHGHYAELARADSLVWDAAVLHDARLDFWQRHGFNILLGLRRPD